MRKLLPLVALLVLAICLWALLETPKRSSSARQEGESTGLVASARQQALTAAARGETAIAQQTSEADLSADPAPAELDASDAREPWRESFAPSGAPFEDLWIQSAKTRAPLAGAKVHFMDGFSKEQLAELFPRDLELGPGVRHVEEEGLALQSDAAGHVGLPRVREIGVVVARHGDLFGLSIVGDELALPWRIELMPDRAWEVRVRDTSGLPIAGLPIVWLARDRNLEARMRTDANGIARLEHAAWALSDDDLGFVQVIPVAVLSEPVSFDWNRSFAPAEPTEFVLPELGLVEVGLREADETARSCVDENVTLHRVNEQPEESFRLERFAQQHEGSLRMHAELGLEIEARWTPEALGETIVARGPGPRAPGELACLRVSLAPELPVARMRVIGADAAPLANTRIRVAYDAGPPHHVRIRELALTTDALGVLRVPLPADPKLLPSAMHISLLDRPDCENVLELAKAPTAGFLDFGELALAEARLIAAGRVVDAVGNGIPDARVDLRTIELVDESPRGAWTLGPRTCLSTGSHGYRGPKASWSVTTDSDGFFKLCSSEPVGQMRVQLVGSPCSERTCTVGEPGKADYLLVGSRSGPTVIEGRVLLPRRLTLRDVALKSNYRGRWLDPAHWISLRADGSWRTEDLHANTWSFGIVPANALKREPLVEVSVEARDQQLTRAPDIDLRSVHVIDFRVVDERGKPVDARVECSPQGLYDPTQFAVRRGQGRLLTMHAQVDARIVAPGYRCAYVPELRDGALIELAAATPLRVRLRDRSLLPPEPYQLVAWLDADAADERFSHLLGSDWQPFGPAGEARLLVEAPGDQSVRLALRDTRHAANPRGDVRLLRGRERLSFEVNVPAEAEVPPLVIDLEPEVVAEALEWLQDE